VNKSLATTESAAPAITVDDLKRKAVHIKDMAESEVRTLADERGAQVVLIGAVVVLAAVSIAFFLGTRAGREY
jgi:hypothetical protein